MHALVQLFDTERQAFEAIADTYNRYTLLLDTYDPRAAINLWEKMQKLGGSQPPQMLSTHPSNESRIADLKVYSEKVMPLYQQATAKR